MHNVHCKIWFAAIVICLLVLASILALNGLDSTGDSQGCSSVAQQPPENNSSPVAIRVETDKSRYALGEIVQIKIFLVNKGPDTVKIAPVNYGYMVFDSERKFGVGLGVNVRWPHGFQYTLPPYGEILVSGVLGWGQKLGRRVGPIWANENVPPGIYTIQAGTSGSVEAAAEVSITIEGNFADYALVLIRDWYESIARYLSSA